MPPTSPAAHLELLPATAHLRVFEPLRAFPVAEREQIAALPQHTAEEWDRLEASALWQRTLRAVTDPFPHGNSEYFRTLNVLSNDEHPHTLYCPGQLQARTLLAAEQVEESLRTEVFDLLVPPAARQANASRIDTERLAADLTHLHTRTATWGIPLSWFALFREDDHTEVVHEQDRLYTVRVHVPFAQAVERLSWAIETMVEHAPQAPLFEELGALGSWLESFDDESVIELDYGSLAEIIWPDDSASDLLHGLQALEDADPTMAAAAYRRLSNRWLGPRHLGRAN
ncbi:hypothetical protein [Glutamicibacter sp. X7]